MQRSARPFRFALLVERVGDGQRLRVEFNKGVDGWSAFVDLVDARCVLFHQRSRGKLAGFHTILQFRNCDFIQFKSLHLRSRCRRSGCEFPGCAHGWIERNGCSGSKGSLEKFAAR